MWPGFDSRIRRQMWVEFVGSLLCTERFSPGTPVSPLLKFESSLHQKNQVCVLWNSSLHQKNQVCVSWNQVCVLWNSSFYRKNQVFVNAGELHRTR